MHQQQAAAHKKTKNKNKLMNWSRGRGTYFEVWNSIWYEMILASQSPAVAKHPCPFGPRGPFTGFLLVNKELLHIFFIGTSCAPILSERGCIQSLVFQILYRV